MSHVITLSDQAYRALEEAGASAGQTPEALIEAWAAQLERDPEQAWFWTPEWQAGEAEATAQMIAGQGEFFESGEDLARAFEERRHRNGNV